MELVIFNVCDFRINITYQVQLGRVKGSEGQRENSLNSMYFLFTLVSSYHLH